MTNKRRAIIALPYEVVAQMLELPDGLTVHTVFADQMRDSLSVKVVGDHLAEVEDGAESPYLPVADRTYLVDAEPLIEALRNLHYEDFGECQHCEDPWPCSTMTVALAAAVAYPQAIRRLRMDWTADR